METLELGEPIERKDKVIFLDWGVFLHKSLFAWEKFENKSIPPTYTAMRMIIACLKRIGVTADDKIIIAIDGKGNWRKKLDPNYKANRRTNREKHDIDWTVQFKSFDNLIKNLDESTQFIPIKIDMLEADDIIAYGCKYFKDNECIIVSSDSDFEQLYAYPNVKIFSPQTKRYKVVDNPYAIIAKKMQKETSDNLITQVVTDKDFEIRNAIINLIHLPKEVESKVKAELDHIKEEKFYDLDRMRMKGIRKIFMQIYDTKDVVDPLAKPKVKRKLKKRIYKEKSQKSA